MTQQPSSQYVQEIELTDTSKWISHTKGEGQESSATVGSFALKEQMVPLDLEGVKRIPSSEFDRTSSPRTWREWLDRTLRMNKSAMGMTRARAVVLILLSFFFVLTTSLLVTGFQGLLPALIKDGVRSITAKMGGHTLTERPQRPILSKHRKRRSPLRPP